MARRHTLVPRSVEALLIRLEELVLANTGEDDFEEIFKLVVAKLWDERTGCSDFGRGADNEERAARLQSLLSAAAAAWPGVLSEARTRLTNQHLATCLDLMAEYRLSESGLEVVDAPFEFLIANASKGSKGQYFTPRYVVDFCVKMINPRIGERVVDPACGSGAFLLHSMQRLVEGGAVAAAQIDGYVANHFWGFDFDPRAVRIANAMMLMSGMGQANFARVNSLVKQRSSISLFDAGGSNGTSEITPFLTIEDVCRGQMRGEKAFDVVLTNPPFAGEVREPEILASYRLARGKRRVERDVLFIERCIDLLRPGGRIAIVLPHNKFAGAAFLDVRTWLRRTLRIVAVVGLGRNTFLPHTHQKANVLFGEKRLKPGIPDSPESIFFAVSERDGKDGQGALTVREGFEPAAMPTWRDVNHDLGEILARFEAFRQSENVFSEA